MIGMRKNKNEKNEKLKNTREKKNPSRELGHFTCNHDSRNVVVLHLIIKISRSNNYVWSLIDLREHKYVPINCDVRVCLR